jgi:hypothetical protein
VIDGARTELTRKAGDELRMASNPFQIKMQVAPQSKPQKMLFFSLQTP